MATDSISSVLKLLLLLLIILFHNSADSASDVKYLPGFEGPLPFELETGYIGVGEEEEVQLFYYFIKSERNPEEDPLLIWLSGGPGCSALSGLFYENGPVTVKLEVYNGTRPSLVSTTYSWTKVSSIIYLDQPVGSGFSYSRTQLAEKPSDSGEVKRIHEFLHKWLSKHQEFSSNPFYVGGDSYSGMVVPALVQEISKGIMLLFLIYQSPSPFPLTLSFLIQTFLFITVLKRYCRKLLMLRTSNKPPGPSIFGYVLGNPSTEREVDYNYRVPYAHGMALISDELYESMKRTCKGKYENVDPCNTECLKLVKEYQKCTDRINKAFILMSYCEETEDTPPDCYVYRYLLTTYWANDGSVRRALRIREDSIGKWVRCYWKIPYTHDIKSSVPYHMNNSISGYPSLIFSGDHDMFVPFLGTQAWIRSLNYSLTDDWRPWMIGDQIAGYTRTYANKMTFATIKASLFFGGGHTPEYKPDESSIMFQRWINGQPL
ncbi:unnamed protein product [Thlaspi arvense]|uniref:Serine carboxypeptidase-like 7 n=1 Tax=Thlaspi arvense TaxID=13288 RepID=A0AAU9S365_THLAR|nr:unnamed protein product [Thlaspi arvense]